MIRDEVERFVVDLLGKNTGFIYGEGFCVGLCGGLVDLEVENVV